MGIVQSSSENKADYSSQRAMQEYAIAILQELPTIDRKKCGIYSEIAAPVFFQNKIAGFIGLDNPYQNISQLFIQQLAFVGAHLFRISC